MIKAAQCFPATVAVAIVCLAGAACANDVEYSLLDNRFAELERPTGAVTAPSRHVVQTAAFLSAEELPEDAPRELDDLFLEDASVDDSIKDTPRCAECYRDPACCNCYHPATHGGYYAEVQLFWLRTHMNEGAIGKLTEQYELSPRIALGFEDREGLGGRLRYWHYGHQTPLLGSGDGIRFQFDVYDAEATQSLRWGKTELTLAGGLRWADLEVLYDDRLVHNDLPGLTLAVDLRRILFGNCRREWFTICGGRWSVLGGDWEGSNSGFIDTVRDDNITVQELYGGFEFAYHARRYDAYARITFEVQNWHSDAAAQSAGTDSFGFVGPGLHFGILR